MRVADIASNEPVAVERDRGDVEDRRRAAEHVGRRPEVTQYTSQTPVTTDHFLHNQQTHCVQALREDTHPSPCRIGSVVPVSASFKIFSRRVILGGISPGRLSRGCMLAPGGTSPNVNQVPKFLPRPLAIAGDDLLLVDFVS